MEVLLNNVISNAIRHNYSGGEITIKLQPGQLTIGNTGKNTFDIEQVLKRFQKSGESEGTGLGLTICKKICDKQNQFMAADLFTYYAADRVISIDSRKIRDHKRSAGRSLADEKFVLPFLLGGASAADDHGDHPDNDRSWKSKTAEL